MNKTKSHGDANPKSECPESLVYCDLDNWIDDVVPKPENAIRIMTYNVHGFFSKNFKKTKDEILDVIRCVNPDLLAIEEFVLFQTKSQISYKDFVQFLKSLGFVKIVTDTQYNNVLASKFDCDVIPTIQLGRDPIRGVRRFANIIKIDSKHVGNIKDLIFVGTHLDVYDETGQTRMTQASMITDFIKGLGTQHENTDPMIIIAGDLNCLRPEDYGTEQWEYICAVDRIRKVDTWRMASKDDRKLDATQIFEKDGYIDASVLSDSPIFLSVWANRRVDYIYCRNVVTLQAFAVRNAASDHYPVYADIMM